MLKKILSIVLVCTLIISLIIPVFSKNDVEKIIKETTITVENTTSSEENEKAVEETSIEGVEVDETTPEVVDESTEEAEEPEEEKEEDIEKESTEEEIKEESTTESAENQEETTKESDAENEENKTEENKTEESNTEENNTEENKTEEVNDKKEIENEASPSDIEEVDETNETNETDENSDAEDNEKASPSVATLGGLFEAPEKELYNGSNTLQITVMDPKGEYSVYVVDGDGVYDKIGGSRLTSLSIPNLSNCYIFDGYVIEGTDTKVVDAAGTIQSAMKYVSTFADTTIITPKWNIKDGATKISGGTCDHITYRISGTSLYISPNGYSNRYNFGGYPLGYDDIRRDNPTHNTTVKTAYIEESFKPTSLRGLFTNFDSLEKIVGLEKIDTSECTSMDSLFLGCESLKEVDLSTFDTSKVKDFTFMFLGCSNLSKIIVDKFDTSSCTSSGAMFSNCPKLTGDTSYMLNSTKDIRYAKVGGGGFFTSCDKPYNYTITVKTDDKTYYIYEEYGCGMYSTSSCEGSTLEKLDVPVSKELNKVFDGFVINGKDIKVTDKDGNLTSGAKSGTLFTGPCTIVPSWQTIEIVEKIYWAYYNGNTTLEIASDGSLLSASPSKQGDFLATEKANWRVSTGDNSWLEGITKVVIKDKIAPKSLETWFYGFSGLTNIENIENLDTSKVTSMNGMFDGCEKLKGIDLSKFNTANVEDMSYMFNSCETIEDLDFSSFNTSKVIDMNHMFSGCSNLKNINLASFNTSSVTHMDFMFYYCGELTELDLSTFDTKALESTISMFENCGSLEKLNITGFDTSLVSNMCNMFGGCSSLVTIYSNDFNTDSLSDSSCMFENCGSLVGGDGTKYSDEHMDAAYAVIDGKNGKKGYFTDITAPVVDYSMIYWAYYSSNQTMEIAHNPASLSAGPTKSGNFECGTDYNPSHAGWAEYGPIGRGEPDPNEWIHKEVKKVIIKDIIKPGSLNGWFYSFGVLENIENIENLDTSNVVSMKETFYACYKLKELDLTHFDTSNVTTMLNMFYRCENVDALDVSSFDTSKVKNMEGMFEQCKTVKELDLSSFDTSLVTNMANMFHACINLVTLDISNFNTSKVTSMYSMFTGSKNLVTIYSDDFETDSLTNSTEIFMFCHSLKGKAGTKYLFRDSSGLPTHVYNFNGTEASWTTVDHKYAVEDGVNGKPGFFSGKKESTTPSTPKDTYESYAKEEVVTWGYYEDTQTMEIADKEGAITANPTISGKFSTDNQPDWVNVVFTTRVQTVIFKNTIKAKTLERWFHGFSDLEKIENIEKLDTSEATSMEHMFYNCFSIVNIDVSNFKTENVTNMDYMFSGCYCIEKLNLSNFNTEKVTTMKNMFENDKSLSVLDISNFNTSKVTAMDYMFTCSNRLVTIYSDDFELDSLSSTGNSRVLFSGCNSLIGGNGTKFTNLAYDAKYAVVDGKDGKPGYFTDKFTPAVDDSKIYWAYYESDKRLEIANAASVLSSGATKSDSFSTDSAQNWLRSGWPNPNEWLHYIEIVDIKTEIKPKNMESFFNTFWGLKEIKNLKNINTSETTTMAYAFDSCRAITSLDLTTFDTSKVTDMSYMFYACNELKTLNLMSFDTSKVIDMGRMFSYDIALTTIFSNDFDTTSLTSSWQMFYNAPVLKGQNGTLCTFGKEDATYAVIDGKNGKPGYFTEKAITDKISAIKVNTGKKEYTIYENYSKGIFATPDCTGEKMMKLEIPTNDNPEYTFNGFVIKETGKKVTDTKSVFSLSTFKGLSFGEEVTVVPSWYYTVKKVSLLSENNDGVQYEYKTIYRGDGIYYSDKEISEDKKIDVKSIKPTKDNYDFVRFVSLDGSEELKGNKDEKAKAYKAEWQPKKYTITFKDGDVEMDTMIEEYGVGLFERSAFVKEKIGVRIPSKEGAIFKGYYSADGLSQYVDEKGNLNASYVNSKTFTSDTTVFSKFEYPVEGIAFYLSDENDANLSAAVFKKGDEFFANSKCDEPKKLANILAENQNLTGEEIFEGKWWPDKLGAGFDTYYAVVDGNEVPVIDYYGNVTKEFLNAEDVSEVYGKWNLIEYQVNLTMDIEEMPFDHFFVTVEGAYDGQDNDRDIGILGNKIDKVKIPVKNGATFLGYYSQDDEMYIDSNGNILIDKFDIEKLSDNQGAWLVAKFSDNLYELQLTAKDVRGKEFILTSGFLKCGKYYRDLECTDEIQLKEVETTIKNCKEIMDNVTGGALASHHMYIGNKKIEHAEDFEEVIEHMDLKTTEKNKIQLEYK